MTKTRNRKRPDRPLNERLKQFSRESRERARQLPIGKEREELIRRARQADEAAKLSQLFES
jgi:membrane protein involved in colicin uptake